MPPHKRLITPNTTRGYVNFEITRKAVIEALVRYPAVADRGIAEALVRDATAPLMMAREPVDKAAATTPRAFEGTANPAEFRTVIARLVRAGIPTTFVYKQEDIERVDGLVNAVIRFLPMEGEMFYADAPDRGRFSQNTFIEYLDNLAFVGSKEAADRYFIAKDAIQHAVQHIEAAGLTRVNPVTGEVNPATGAVILDYRGLDDEAITAAATVLRECILQGTLVSAVVDKDEQVGVLEENAPGILAVFSMEDENVKDIKDAVDNARRAMNDMVMVQLDINIAHLETIFYTSQEDLEIPGVTVVFWTVDSFVKMLGIMGVTVKDENELRAGLEQARELLGLA